MDFKKEFIENGFPGYSMENLEAHGVFETVDESYLFVHVNHPVIYIMKANADELKLNIHEHKPFNGQWYTVSANVFIRMCELLRSCI